MAVSKWPRSFSVAARSISNATTTYLIEGKSAKLLSCMLRRTISPDGIEGRARLYDNRFSLIFAPLLDCAYFSHLMISASICPK